MREAPDSHAQFVLAVSEQPYWVITRPWRAVFLAWGVLGRACLVTWYAAILLVPLALLAGLCVRSENYWLGFWAPVVVLSSWGGLDRTVLGVLPALALFLLAGLPLTFFLGGAHLLAAASPIFAWMFSTLLRQAFLGVFLRSLARSPRAWQRVVDDGLLSQR